MKKYIPIAIILVALIFLGYFVLSFFGGGILGFATNTFSEGYRDVYISKVTRKGSAVKVWEVAGAYHGYVLVINEDGKIVAGGFTANVDDEKVKDKLGGIRADELARCYFRERFVRGLDSSTYVIESVERLDDILPKNR